MQAGSILAKRGKGGIEKMGHIVFVAISADQVDLVFHQGDKGRHDYGASGKEDTGKLVTKAFTSTGGFNDESVISCHEVFDDSFLVTFKIVKTEMFLESGLQVNSCRNGCNLWFRGV